MTGIVNGEPQAQAGYAAAGPYRLAPGCWCRGKCPHAEEPKRLERERLAGPAETAWRQVLLEAPDCVEANKALARILVWDTHAGAAAGHLEAAIEVEGLTPELALLVAHNRRHQVKLDEALEAAKRARDLNHDDPKGAIAVANVYQARGEIDAMESTIGEAVARFGEVPALRHVRALLAAERKDFAKVVELLAGGGPPGPGAGAAGADLSPAELFERGRAKERLADYAGAWSDWMAGKAIQRANGCIYPQARMQQVFAEHQEMARPARIKLYRRGAGPRRTPRPIFITGFPRSGTTMVEAVLSRHRYIRAGDELPFLNDMVARVPGALNVTARYPKALMAFAWRENEDAAEILADWYCRLAMRKIDGVDKFFTDKMVSNEIHLPLIGILFPGVAAVHVRRHPLDIMVSNMSHALVHGRFNACALEWCATHYAMTDQLLARYRDVAELLAVNLVELKYEEFVADSGTTTAQLLAAIGLPFESQCVAFHESSFQSRTISHRQIKEPLHAGAVGRFRPFLEFLKPVLPVLRDTMEREGYAL